MISLRFVLCSFFISVTLASGETYRAASFPALGPYTDSGRFLPLIKDAAEAKADVVVIPSSKVFAAAANIDESCGVDNYDELVKELSGASKQAGVYVVAHLLEKTRCQHRDVLVRSNLVFNRQGDIVSVYRKPVNYVANCTSSPKNIGTFPTDFGVTFGVLMEEDLVLLENGDLNGLKNFVVIGDWSSEIPFLSASQFASSWAFVNNANVITPSGIYAGGAAATNEANMMLADMKKQLEDEHTIVFPAMSSELKMASGEDLSLYTIRPLDVEASVDGFKETVCHGEFCCDFYIKSKFSGHKHDDNNYGLAVYTGARTYSRSHAIGTQICALIPCVGLYKRTCSVGLNANIAFEKISISGNFSSDNDQYPVVLSRNSPLTSDNIAFQTSNHRNQKHVTLAAENVQDVLHFGIFGRDSSKDSVNASVPSETFDIYEYIFNEDTHEFFDYIWIRLRILIFIVSIYVLEML